MSAAAAAAAPTFDAMLHTWQFWFSWTMAAIGGFIIGRSF